MKTSTKNIIRFVFLVLAMVAWVFLLMNMKVLNVCFKVIFVAITVAIIYILMETTLWGGIYFDYRKKYKIIKKVYDIRYMEIFEKLSQEEKDEYLQGLDVIGRKFIEEVRENIGIHSWLPEEKLEQMIKDVELMMEGKYFPT